MPRYRSYESELPRQLNERQFWEGFSRYLETDRSPKVAKVRLVYAQRYSHVLRDSNGQELLELPTERRILAMKSLSCPSQYLGCYREWRDLKDNYQLKWSNDDTLKAFSEITSRTNNLASMMDWLRDACSKLPESQANVLRLNALTGLRPDEACTTIALLRKDRENYLNPTTLMLEHFRYPNIFLRHTKKAFVSIVTPEILRLAAGSCDTSYNALRLSVRRKGLQMHMKYCRKIFATYLRTHGIEQEIIDLLQGRIPKSVFARHYFRPDFQENCSKITSILKVLTREIV